MKRWLALFLLAPLPALAQDFDITHAGSQGADKGQPFQGDGSAALVMRPTGDGWRAAADIVGEEPDPPASGGPGPDRQE